MSKFDKYQFLLFSVVFQNINVFDFGSCNLGTNLSSCYAVANKNIIFGILGAYEIVISYIYFCPAYKNERVVRDLRDRISKLLLVYWVIGRKAVAILNCSAIRL
jgi:hypothetical protein